MYTLYSRYMDTNGYILIYLPGHPRAIGKWCEKYGIENHQEDTGGIKNIN